MRGWYGEYELPGAHREAFPEQDEKVMALEVRGNGPEGTAIPMTPAAQVAKNQRFL